MSVLRQTLLLMLACVVSTSTIAAFADEGDSLTARYFQQLRQRGLFRLAENHAESRLADPQLKSDLRIDLAIELSRTLAAHAAVVGDDEEAELWKRAGAVIEEERTAAADSPRRILLDGAAAMVPVLRTESLMLDLETSPFDEPVRETLDHISTEALQQLALVERSLADRLRKPDGKTKAVIDLTVDEHRRLAAQVHLRWGQVMQARARLSSGGTQERQADLVTADERFRKVSNSSSAEEQFAARLGLAISNRLRDELDRAFEMLDSLESDGKNLSGGRKDAIRLERARVLLNSRRPDAAAQELLQMQAGRPVSGEFWFVQFQVLAAMKRVANERGNRAISAELQERATEALADVERQVGGVWSRRCRSIWSAAESVERYGHRLAALVAQARAEYVAGRTPAAITAYSSAVDLAQESGQQELAMEVGSTLAGILAQDERWEELVSRCRQLVAAQPQHARAAEIDLLGIYGQGRLVDQDPTAERRTRYARELADHLRRYPNSETAGEVAYLQGRLAETEQRTSDAVDAYDRVRGDHMRSPAAAAAMARCCVLRLLEEREVGRHDVALDRDIINRLTPKLRSLPENAATWTDSQAELAYQAVRALLLVEPPRLDDAERWLNQLNEATTVSGEEAKASAQRSDLRQRTGPLRLVVFASQGKPQAAEQLLGTLSQAGPWELLAVVEELSQIHATGSETARRSLIETQLAAAELLDRRRAELTAAQQQRLDLALAKSYFATTQSAKAIAVYQRMLEQSPRDAGLTRRLGQLLLLREEPACRLLAKFCWQRVEGLLKQGTDDWLDARCRTIECCLLLGEREQARKLLKVTKLLYPQLGGEELRSRYTQLETQLD